MQKPDRTNRRGAWMLRACLSIRVRDAARGRFLAAICGATLVLGALPSWSDEVEGREIAVDATSGAASQSAPAPTYRANDEDDWKFLASVNPWFIFIIGPITVMDTSGMVDISFGNIWEALHMAMFADVEVQKGNIGLFTDISWARLWKRQDEGPLNFKTDLDWVLFDFGLYYEALSLKLGSGPLPPRLRLQPYFGGRYQYFGTEIKVRGTFIDRVLSPTSHTAAPILGLRGFLDINDRWNVNFAGDGGGFGVDGVDVTWLGEVAVGYRLRFYYWGDWDLNVLAGYKAVGVDVKSGTEDIGTDLIYHGPVLKIGVEF